MVCPRGTTENAEDYITQNDAHTELHHTVRTWRTSIKLFRCEQTQEEFIKKRLTVVNMNETGKRSYKCGPTTRQKYAVDAVVGEVSSPVCSGVGGAVASLQNKFETMEMQRCSEQVWSLVDLISAQFNFTNLLPQSADGIWNKCQSD